MEWCDEDWLQKCLKLAYKYASQIKTLNVVFHKNRLVVNGKCYTADNLFDIPKAFNPLYIFTPCTANKVAFYTSLSPLSNHFPSPLQIDGIRYNCVEQYFMCQKALLFNDKVAENLILHTNNPARQKFLGRKIKNFDKKVWDQHVPEVLWKGLLAKFQQNINCLTFLRNTENRQLYEANDPLYGVGINLFDSKIWNERFHRGHNLMGIYLQRIRAHFLRNVSKNSCGPGECTLKTDKMDSVKSFEIGSRKKANINEYKGVSYIHFYDAAKGKSFTFSSTEFKELMTKKDEIEGCFIFLNRRREKRDEELLAYGTSKAGGEKRYADPEEYYAPYGLIKQKQLRPSPIPDYGEVPSSSTAAAAPSSSQRKLVDY